MILKRQGERDVATDLVEMHDPGDSSVSLNPEEGLSMNVNWTKLPIEYVNQFYTFYTN